MTTNKQYESVRLGNDPHSKTLMQKAFDKVYYPLFNSPEDYGIEYFLAALENTAPGQDQVVLLVGENLDDPNKAKIHGLGAGIYFPESSTAVNHYRIGSKEERGAGSAVKFSMIDQYRQIASEQGKSLRGLFGVVHDPDIVMTKTERARRELEQANNVGQNGTTEFKQDFQNLMKAQNYDTADPYNRMRAHSKYSPVSDFDTGAAAIPIHYVEPEKIVPGMETPSSDMWVLVTHNLAKAEGEENYPSKQAVIDYLYDYHRSLGHEDPTTVKTFTNPVDYLKQRDAFKCVPLPRENHFENLVTGPESFEAETGVIVGSNRRLASLAPKLEL